MTKTKIKKEIEPFFNELVLVYFHFCCEKFNREPSFDGSSPRDLKNIIKSLHKRAISSNIEWNLEASQQRLYKFLEYAYQDKWLRYNFLLSNILRQKDKLFFNIQQRQNQNK